MRPTPDDATTDPALVPVSAPDQADHNQVGPDQPTPQTPRLVRCPMLACGRLHELPPDFA
ncbi:hypothetical protein [Streptomyces sp. BBFR102]|uniref:hypothetical protein n=1 Tax=Streptomyces sp. BBFR102 TaxID=3448171 RepID=UPI003F537F13